jgi:lycopene beta-cyclase
VPDSRFDYVLVGGGLQSGLCALALAAHQPGARIAMVERGAVPGGNHTWCVHEGDLSPADRAWVEPLLVHRWDGYDVAFPAHRRTLPSSYAAVTSARFAEVVTAAIARGGGEVLTGATALDVQAREVVVAVGGGRRTLRGDVVVDARGPDHGAPPPGGFQKFVGLEVTTARPHGVARPVMMDATVEQLDGYRFLYVLPLAADRLLVEDTYFSDSAYLDVAELRERTLRYAAQRGWAVAAIDRQEQGVVPLPWALDVPTPTAGPLVGGVQGGWFHPVTGYSFPVAARLAALVGRTPPGALFGDELAALAARHRRQLGVALRMNWMLFRWFPPERRYHVLERFYRLPEPTIRRFYALDLTAADVARIFVGRPPRGMSWKAALAPREVS